MKVKLIQITQNPIDVMWTAARTCYASESPVNMWDNWQKILDPDNEDVICTFEEYNNKKEKHWKLVQKVLNSGHQSVAEHVYFTFAIEGISRACSHQLVRHRHCTFSQQSQRYVEIKEDVNTLLSLIQNYEKGGETKEQEDYMQKELTLICSKYFIDVNLNNFLRYSHSLLWYLMSIEDGNKAEDARNLLPNATKTNITMSVNYRELMHMCNLRLCTRAQSEIRNLFKEIVNEVKQHDEKLAQYLVPQCEVHGFCIEHNCCGRKPHLSELKTKQLTPERLRRILEDNYEVCCNIIDKELENPHYKE